MKTHKQVKIIGLVDGGQNIVKCIATKDIATFPLGEALRSNKFDGHAAGSYVQVTVRCSDRYRFILGVVEASNEVLADYKTDDTTWAADHYAVIFGEELVAKANEIAAAHQGIVAALAQKVEKMAQAERPYFYISPEHKKVSGFSMNMLKKNSKRGITATYPPGAAPEKAAKIMFADFMLEGQWFAAMDSGHMHAFGFTEALSLLVQCDSQEEIDAYWSALSAVPEAEQCGWLKDKFGVSWQVNPAELQRIMQSGDKEKIARVTKAFLQMKKFDLAALRKAEQSV
jgi:predicted 3-demethylubiquinone-9 3-methyltransferase (glyoxalase superfamily)